MTDPTKLSEGRPTPGSSGLRLNGGQEDALGMLNSDTWERFCDEFRKWLLSDVAAHGQTGMPYESNRALCWIQIEGRAVLNGFLGSRGELRASDSELRDLNAQQSDDALGILEEWPDQARMLARIGELRASERQGGEPGQRAQAIFQKARYGLTGRTSGVDWETASPANKRAWTAVEAELSQPAPSDHELRVRDWAVRVLAEAAKAKAIALHIPGDRMPDMMMVPIGDAVRLAAARSVFPELPADVRERLGSEP